MIEMANLVFWFTGAVVWTVFGTCFLLLLYGEWSCTRAANRFRRKHMTPEEYAMLQECQSREAPTEVGRHAQRRA
jgi:hypothetical protein